MEGLVSYLSRESVICKRVLYAVVHCACQFRPSACSLCRLRSSLTGLVSYPLSMSLTSSVPSKRCVALICRPTRALAEVLSYPSRSGLAVAVVRALKPLLCSRAMPNA
ncbi:hypothetical protein D3C72_2153800 [compost metagenome]